MRSRWIRRASVAVVCPMILLAGCADRQRPAVEQTATAFLAAVGAGDTRVGCALLAPATRDLLEYRDAMTIVRDRVQDLIDQGRTLAEVKAANPTLGYRSQYGTDSGPWTTDMFVEVVYNELAAKKWKK